MWEIHLGCELHFLWIWWLCDHVYQRTAILVLCWLRRTVQSSFVQIFFSTVLTIALCLYQGATKAVKKWLNFGWTDFFVCCKVCWGLSREALEMELLLYKVRPKYHQLLGSEETSILSAHGAGTILCWPFFWCGESKAWPFGHRPKPVLQPNGIKHIWWWRFCRKNKEVGTNVPTYVSRLPVPRKIRSLCVLPVAATVDGLMINWYIVPDINKFSMICTTQLYLFDPSTQLDCSTLHVGLCGLLEFLRQLWQKGCFGLGLR